MANWTSGLEAPIKFEGEDYVIVFSYSGYCPPAAPTGPTYESGGEQGWPAEFEIRIDAIYPDFPGPRGEAVVLPPEALARLTRAASDDSWVYDAVLKEEGDY